MKYIGISGSWRKTDEEIEEKVRSAVREIFEAGNGMISGGALGVDYIATDEALKLNPEADRIKIFIPTTLEKYSEHYRKHAKLGTITKEQAENLISQLEKIRNANPESLIENPDENFTEETKKKMYYERNSRAVEASDELVAFRIKTRESESLGTADAIQRAEEKGIPVKEYSWDLTE